MCYYLLLGHLPDDLTDRYRIVAFFHQLQDSLVRFYVPINSSLPFDFSPQFGYIARTTM
jgi:hypothetical protein